MYQPQQNQANISPGLSALMELQRTAAATTPDGTPTIASQVAQKVQGMQGQGQEQPQAPQGIAGIAPNLPPQVQNALVGGQIKQGEEEKAKQAMMQMAQQQQAAQQQQPVFAQGGIAALPADNMHNMGRYAQGGVIGFYEGGTSAVEYIQEQLQREEEDRNKKPEQFSDATIARIGQMRAKQADDAKKVIDSLPREALADILPKGTVPTRGFAVDVPEVKQPAFETNPNTGLIVQGSTPAPVGIAKTLPTPVVQTQLNRPAVAAKPPPAAAPAQTVPGMEMPTMARTSDIDAQTTFLAPNVDTSDYEAKVSAMGKLAKEREPSTAIADLTKAEEKRKALETSRLGNYNINALMKFAIAAGKSYRPGAGGAAVAEFNEEQHKLAQMNQQAEAMFDASIRREKEAAFAIRMGDAKTATELAKQSVDMRQAAQDARAKVASNVMTAATSAFHSNVQMYNQKLSNLSNEQINAANIKARTAGNMLSSSEATAKLNYINAQAAQLAKEEGSPTVLPKHTLAARMAWEAAGGPVQAALINARQREGAATGAAEAKLMEVLRKHRVDFEGTREGRKAGKATTAEEKTAATAAWKDYVSKISPAELEGVSPDQLVGAGGGASSGVTRLKFDTSGKQI